MLKLEFYCVDDNERLYCVGDKIPIVDETLQNKNTDEQLLIRCKLNDYYLETQIVATICKQKIVEGSLINKEKMDSENGEKMDTAINFNPD